MGLELTPDQFRPTVIGPQITGLCNALAKTFAPFMSAPDELIDAVDIRPPTWNSSRPIWHLDLLEKIYQVRVVAGHTSAERYRLIQLSIAARWSCGRTADLIRIAAAWVGVTDLAADVAEVMCWPLVAAVIFSPAAAPQSAAEIALFSQYLVKGLQDVAGWVLILKPEGEQVFTLDIGPGLDVSVLGEILAQIGP